ncbi:hypothetical protein BGW80DRAFT_341504 [Lactifluus volemus]|nr:hypothetical protein BGW80DRAFT_341504 [Lactifluus volemus]
MPVVVEYCGRGCELATTLATSASGINWPKTWPNTLSLKFTRSASAVPIMELQQWVRSTTHVAVRFKPAFAPDGDSFGLPMLVDWLKANNCYAIGSWVLQGNDRPTPNLLVTSCGRGLLGFAFPSSPMPTLPKPQSGAIVNPTTFRQQVSRAAPYPKYVVSQQRPQRRARRRVTDYQPANVRCAVTEDTALVQNEIYSSAHEANMISSGLHGRLLRTLA